MVLHLTVNISCRLDRRSGKYLYLNYSRFYSHTLCPCATTGLSWSSVRHPLEEMKYLLTWCRRQARRWVLPLNTPCLQNSAESGERSVLTLGSLCLPCSVWDTAWSWKKNQFSAPLDKVWRWIPPLNALFRKLGNSTLIPAPFYLSCYLRDTAWFKKKT